MRTFAQICLFALTLAAQTGNPPVRSVTDPGVVTTRQAITPAGVPTVFDGRVYGVAFGRDASEIWVSSASKIYRLDWKANKVLESAPAGGVPGLQGIRFDAVSARPLVSAAVRSPSGPTHVQLLSPSAGKTDKWSAIGGDLGATLAGAIAIADRADSQGRRLAVVPLTANNQLAVVDLEHSTSVGTVATGIAPFGAAISPDGAVAFVTNWGGRIPSTGDPTANAGADPVVVDERGIASTGTVTRIDLTTLKATHTIAVGLHPTAIVWDAPGQRVYVANGNSDTISVIDTEHMTVLRTIPLQPFAIKVAGIAPTALALSPDRKTLYAACGGINAIAVLDAQSGALRGLIPTAWYPNGLAVSTDGKWIAVSALLGVGSGWRETPSKRYVHSNRGTVAVLPAPDAPQLASYTAAVATNNRMTPAGTPERSAAAPLRPAQQKPPAPSPIPARAGDPSLIEHVVFIIKENRTYDQVYGDMDKGNGDPSLVMFGREVTPNQHKLADEFVLLDNFYATGGNSADGHQWLTQANETDYCMWPGYEGRSYPFNGTDPIAYSKNGFLWDYALARGKSIQIYGEYAGSAGSRANRQNYLTRWRDGEDFGHEWQAKAPIAPLNKILAKNYPAYSTNIPDVARARIFLADVQRMEKDRAMPNLMLVQLPSNHTNGTTPGGSTPRAMVADNDFAVGQIVEGLTKTRFWPQMAIFIVEDDAQNGVDHVDGHRTAALAVSPYIRRGYVDSTFYSTQSMVKSIELILGLPTMSLFDLIAEDMRASFQDSPDLTPFTAVDPQISLFEVNPPTRALNGSARQAAADSARMRFDIPDAAPTEKLNRILWHSVRGWNTAYPGPRHAVFAPLSVDLDDDARERK